MNWKNRRIKTTAYKPDVHNGSICENIEIKKVTCEEAKCDFVCKEKDLKEHCRHWHNLWPNDTRVRTTHDHPVFINCTPENWMKNLKEKHD
jgi:hypothetical protein